jgi:hypothetical protein
MVTGIIGRGVLLSGIVLVALLSPSLLPERAAPVASQDPSLEARVQQLEARLATVEARLAALAPVVSAAPATATDLDTYRAEFRAILTAYGDYQQRVTSAVGAGASQEDRSALAEEGAVLYRSLAQRIRTLAPPACYLAAHIFLARAANLLDVAATFGLGTTDVSLTENLLVTALAQAEQAFATARC